MGLEQVHYEATVGMPSVRTPPCGLGISTFRTACGMYSPANSACLTFAPCAYRLPARLRSPPRAPTRPACCCVPPRPPSAVMLPVSFPQQPPIRPLHPHPIPAGSACLRRRGPYLRTLLLYQLASRSAVLLPCFTFGPSRSRDRYYGLGLTSGDPSQHLSMSAALQQTARSPRVSRTHLPAYACRIYVAAFRARTGLHKDLPAYPAAPPLSASCSSGQRFACSFLPIPSRDGHRCRSANTSPCRVCRGLSPPSECALPGAQMKSAGGFPPALRHAELPEFGRLLHHDLVSARVQGSLNTNALAFEFFHFVLMIDVIGLTRIVLQNVFVSLLYDRT